MAKVIFQHNRLTSQRCAWGLGAPGGRWLWRKSDSQGWRWCLQPVFSPTIRGTQFCMKSCSQLTATSGGIHYIGNIHWALINTFYNCLILFLSVQWPLFDACFEKCQKVHKESDKNIFTILSRKRFVRQDFRRPAARRTAKYKWIEFNIIGCDEFSNDASCWPAKYWQLEWPEEHVSSAPELAPGLVNTREGLGVRLVCSFFNGKVGIFCSHRTTNRLLLLDFGKGVFCKMNQWTVKMSKVDSKFKQSFCQSRFYKSWNPDYLADYNRWAH